MKANTAQSTFIESIFYLAINWEQRRFLERSLFDIIVLRTICWLRNKQHKFGQG